MKEIQVSSRKNKLLNRSVHITHFLARVVDV